MKLWDWNYALEILPLLARASIVTIEVTLLAFVLAATLGLALALMRLSRLRLAAYPATAFVEVVRSTPLLIQIFFLYFVLPEFGITLGPLTVGVIALGVHYATYCAEVYRAGLENVPRGQWEATVALNMDTFHTLRDVIIPQAIPPVVPALGNYFVALFKETPLLSAIAVLELMQQAKDIGSETFRYVEPITLVGGFFLLFSLIAAALVRLLERRLSRIGARA
ncbi:MAG: ectoine/hydroxyectoine transporter, permease protein EhuD [Xanthobacteraceae bacterium]|jgi:polar amino acid transport system permease protein|nr:ectoine/hydroxyectoine transporter, permease protein EhuD [Xanthobacteraceae bacterium]